MKFTRQGWVMAYAIAFFEAAPDLSFDEAMVRALSEAEHMHAERGPLVIRWINPRVLGQAGGEVHQNLVEDEEFYGEPVAEPAPIEIWQRLVLELRHQTLEARLGELFRRGAQLAHEERRVRALAKPWSIHDWQGEK